MSWAHDYRVPGFPQSSLNRKSLRGIICIEVYSNVLYQRSSLPLHTQAIPLIVNLMCSSIQEEQIKNYSFRVFLLFFKRISNIMSICWKLMLCFKAVPCLSSKALILIIILGLKPTEMSLFWDPRYWKSHKYLKKIKLSQVQRQYQLSLC